MFAIEKNKKLMVVSSKHVDILDESGNIVAEKSILNEKSNFKAFDQCSDESVLAMSLSKSNKRAFLKVYKITTEQVNETIEPLVNIFRKIPLDYSEWSRHKVYCLDNGHIAVFVADKGSEVFVKNQGALFFFNSKGKKIGRKKVSGRLEISSMGKDGVGGLFAVWRDHKNIGFSGQVEHYNYKGVKIDSKSESENEYSFQSLYVINGKTKIISSTQRNDYGIGHDVSYIWKNPSVKPVKIQFDRGCKMNADIRGSYIFLKDYSNSSYCRLSGNRMVNMGSFAAAKSTPVLQEGIPIKNSDFLFYSSINDNKCVVFYNVSSQKWSSFCKQEVDNEALLNYNAVALSHEQVVVQELSYSSGGNSLYFLKAN